MIRHNVRFLESIKNELLKQSYKFWFGFVQYYDKNSVSKNLTLFEKPLEFEYQKEFRFYVESKVIKPIKIQIGSLIKYAEIFTIDEIKNLKKIEGL